jgi:hypothetical protein
MNKKSNINDKGEKMTPQKFERLVLDNDELVDFVCRYGSGMPKSEAKKYLRRYLAKLYGPDTSWEEFQTNFMTNHAVTIATLAVATKKGMHGSDELKDVLSHEDWHEVFLLSKQMLTWNSEAKH